MLFQRKSDCKTLSMAQAQRILENDTSIHLIDVRTVAEYRQGHIPNSVNIPLDRLQDVRDAVPDKNARIFVHCLSGARSAQACSLLVSWGYTDVTNIGGISQWRGAIVQ